MNKPLHLPEGREARVAMAPPTIEYRAIEGGGQEPVAFVGEAVVCGVRSESLGWPGFRFVETIDARALDETDLTDVIGVFNHDPNQLLGRNQNNTLALARTENGGMSYRIPYDVEDPDHKRVMRKIERGDVTGSSFLFLCKEDEWSEEKTEDGGSLYVRNVRAIAKLYDVGPVTSPAYSDSKAAKRSLDAYTEAHPAPLPTVPLEILSAELALKARR